MSAAIPDEPGRDPTGCHACGQGHLSQHDLDLFLLGIERIARALEGLVYDFGDYGNEPAANCTPLARTAMDAARMALHRRDPS